MIDISTYIRMEEADDVVTKLDNRGFGKHRVTYEARLYGMKEAQKEYDKRKASTQYYCRSTGIRYEDALKMSAR